ncbi:MAG TPA: ATP synthase F1 subunit epsilon [Polyangiaceae bacterium]|nr:ATP synthase F1 subunit epsilon [Polyangiaceae bacterium]
MADKIQLEIVTPRGRALTAAVDEVTAPSVAGEFGVLPGHLPLLAALKTGIVTYKQAGETKRCAVGGGFAEAGPDRLVMLTDEYAERDQIDPVVVRRDLADVQQQLQALGAVPIVAAGAIGADAAAAEARARREVLVARENWLAAQLELYGDPPPATMRPFEEYGPPAPFAEDEIPATGNGQGGPVAKPGDSK